MHHPIPEHLHFEMLQALKERTPCEWDALDPDEYHYRFRAAGLPDVAVELVPGSEPLLAMHLTSQDGEPVPRLEGRVLCYPRPGEGADYLEVFVTTVRGLLVAYLDRNSSAVR